MKNGKYQQINLLAILTLKDEAPGVTITPIYSK
jgi:hypothetical protein